jgi:tRNA-specific 2-thiouridylase
MSGDHSKAALAIALSGGVDSAVTALLLTRAGLRPTAIYMNNWEMDDAGECPGEIDARDAAAIAARLELPFHVRNLAAVYWERVFEHFLAEHRAGRTPNPDVLCNREVKFSALVEAADALGASQVATGHYARLDQRNGRWRLLKAVDQSKDQSYFLHLLDQQQLARACFPLGELHKSEVRRLASEAGLAVAGKKDSTGICFIGERSYRPFLQRFLPRQPGPILSDRGQTLGTHEGLAFYTLGQRGGLGIGGVQGRPDAPWYVLAKRSDDNTLIVGQGVDHPALYSRELWTGEGHFIAGAAAAGRFEAHAKTRYRQPDQACEVEVLSDGSWHLRFEQPQRAVTPGQSVVLYRGDECLGGAVIDRCDAPAPLNRPSSNPASSAISS